MAEGYINVDARSSIRYAETGSYGFHDYFISTRGSITVVSGYIVVNTEIPANTKIFDLPFTLQRFYYGNFLKNNGSAIYPIVAQTNKNYIQTDNMPIPVGTYVFSITLVND